MTDLPRRPAAEPGGDGRQRKPRIGVYVCHCGGNIADVVDVEQVVAQASRLDGVVVARHYSAMCSQGGQDLVIDDMRRHDLDRAVIAACTPDLHEHTFRATLVRAERNPYLYEHVNIREQVSWCSKSDPQGATQKAARLVAAGVAKARLLEPLSPISREVCRHVSVIGGGISGLRAARDLSRAGFSVALLEQSPSLGGQVTQWSHVYPTGASGRELVGPLVDEVSGDPNIAVYTGAEVREVSGCAGDFHLTARQSAGVDGRSAAAGDIELHSGAIVLATGFELYRPRRGEFGFEEHPQVITLAELERLLAEQAAVGKSLERNGRKIRNVCLIHCVGSRQIEGLHEPGAAGTIHEYCSRVCCTATLQAAAALRQRFPHVNVFDLYRDIRTYGRNHEQYYEEATRLGVIFFRYTPEHLPVVAPAGAGDSGLSVTVRDTLTFGEEVSIPADLVVLATGMVPRRLETLIEQLKLSRSADGFLQELHPKLRPVELAVRGVFVAGTCQAPMDVSESCASGSAAAAKAAALLGKGTIELDPFRARVDPQRCQGEGKCVEVCEHQRAITLVDDDSGDEGRRRAVIDAMLCNGCGMCAPVCPNRAIEVDGWHLDQFEAMVDALTAADPCSG